MASLTSPVHNTTHTYYGDRDILQTTLNIWKNKPDNGMISRYIYSVNNLGQRTAVATAGEAFDTASPADWQWSYDALGQVKSAIETSIMATRSCQYSYDQIGNRISSQKGNSPELSYVANNLNQYATIGTSVTPTYDADGNQLGGLMPTAELPERGQFIFRYNAHNRPIAVAKNDANNTVLQNYTHDHEGRRIQEGNTITIYDGYNAIAEYTVNGVLQTTYAWGLDLSHTLQGAGGVGGLLSQTDYTTQTPLVSYPTYDGNGNVTEYVTEANNGTIATHYEYDSFGNVIKKTGTKEYRYQFSTKPYNKLTGLNYYNYRDYDPVSGRWASPDPIEEQGGLNLYGFVGNDGINLVDRLGMCDIGYFEGGWHYVFGSGHDLSTSIDSLGLAYKLSDFGVTPCSYSIGSENIEKVKMHDTGSDAPGRVNVRLKGSLTREECKWKFSGTMTVDDDKFDFNPSDRPFLDEMITTIIRNCVKGTEYTIRFTGSISLEEDGDCKS